MFILLIRLQGLTTAEAQARLAVYGYNRVRLFILPVLSSPLLSWVVPLRCFSWSPAVFRLQLPPTPRPSVLKLLLRQLTDFIVVVLIISAGTHL